MKSCGTVYVWYVALQSVPSALADGHTLVICISSQKMR